MLETTVPAPPTFVQEPPRTPSTIRAHAFAWEVAEACVAGLLLAMTMLWLVPTLLTWSRTGSLSFADVFHTIPGDVWDPTLQAYQIAWDGHALLHDVSHLWNANGFFPQAYSLAFSDSNLGYAPLGAIGSGPVAAVARYNIIYLLVFALAFVGAYALVRQLGAGRLAGFVAGAAFAYAPWRYSHEGHLQILSTGAIALSLAMLARGHGWSLRDGYRPGRARPGWALAGWLVAAWQVTLGFGIGVPFVYVIGLGSFAALGLWFVSGRPSLPRRLIAFDACGIVVFAGVAALMAYPYLHVLAQYPEARRSWDYVALYSPPVTGFAVAPESSLLWGGLHEPARQLLGPAANEKELLCGLVLYGLATAGLFVSVWTIRQRMLLLAGTLVSGFLALGTNGPLYLFAYLLLPGFDGSRTPGRLVLWTTLMLVILAAGFVTARFTAHFKASEKASEKARRIVLASLLAAVLVEGLPDIDHPRVPQAPAAMAVAPAPMVVLPSDELADQHVLLWSTDGFPLVFNGGSGFDPPRHMAVRDMLQDFPDAQTVDLLHDMGIHSVVVLRDQAVGGPFAKAVDAPIDGLRLTRAMVGNDIVYTLW